MSDETKADLETALQKHIDSERDGYFLAGYAIEAHLVPVEDDGRHHYFSIYPDNQPYHSTYGLLQTAIDDFTTPDEGDE